MVLIVFVFSFRAWSTRCVEGCRDCVADALRVHRDDPEDGRPAPSAPPAVDPPVNVAVVPPPRPCPPRWNSRREIEIKAEEGGLQMMEKKTGVTGMKKVIPDEEEEEASEDPLSSQLGGNLLQPGASALSLAGAAAALAMNASKTHKLG